MSAKPKYDQRDLFASARDGNEMDTAKIKIVHRFLGHNSTAGHKFDGVLLYKKAFPLGLCTTRKFLPNMAADYITGWGDHESAASNQKRIYEPSRAGESISKFASDDCNFLIKLELTAEDLPVEGTNSVLELSFGEGCIWLTIKSLENKTFRFDTRRCVSND